LEIYTGTRMSMTVEAAQKLKESLEYGLAKTHLTPAAPDSEGHAAIEQSEKISFANHLNEDLQ